MRYIREPQATVAFPVGSRGTLLFENKVRIAAPSVSQVNAFGSPQQVRAVPANFASETTCFRGGASPGRKTGCGLKQHVISGGGGGTHGITRSKDRVRIETVAMADPGWYFTRITRSKDRVRIETCIVDTLPPLAKASPGRKTGCGLKPPAVISGYGNVCITRSKDRVRIETSPTPPSPRR